MFLTSFISQDGPAIPGLNASAEQIIVEICQEFVLFKSMRGPQKVKGKMFCTSVIVKKNVKRLSSLPSGQAPLERRSQLATHSIMLPETLKNGSGSVGWVRTQLPSV